MKNSLTIDDHLKVVVIWASSPNIRRLLVIYEIIPHTEAVLECGLSRLGQIATKKLCAFNDENLNMPLRISHRKGQLKSHKLNQ